MIGSTTVTFEVLAILCAIEVGMIVTIVALDWRANRRFEGPSRRIPKAIARRVAR